MSQEQTAMPEPKKAAAAGGAPASDGGDKVVPIAKAQPKKIAMVDFQLNVAGQMYNTWLASVAVGVTERDCLQPEFWAHVARKINPMDRIEVWAKDGAWFGEFRVIFSADREARVQKVQKVDIDANLTDDINKDPEYLAKWIAPPVKYGVIRKSDGEIVAKNFATVAHAELWIAQRRRATA